MKRRIVAALLALGIPLTLLTSCGSKNAADQFFDTLKSIHGLKDYHIELTISSDEANKNGLRISGDVAKSNHQAQLTVTAYSENTKEEGTLNLLVDGNDFYLQPADWTRYVAERYSSAGEGVEQEANLLESQLLLDIAKEFGNNYYKVTAAQPIFELLSSDSQPLAADAFSSWYDELRTELSGAIHEADATYTLNLKEDQFQDQSLALLKNLIDNEDTYREAVQPTLNSVEDAIVISGWTNSEILDNIWSDYQERNSELSQLKQAGKCNDQTFTMTDGEKGSDGAYQVSLTWKGATERYIQARITPAELPADFSIPNDAVSYSDQAENLSTVFMDSKNMPNPKESASDSEPGTETSDGSDPEVDWSKWSPENEKDDTKDYSADLQLSKLKGYSHIKLTPMSSEDGRKTELPVVTDYDYCDASYSEDGNTTALYLTSDSWTVDVYNIEATDRTPEQILSENINTYVSTYQDDWGYKITQKVSKVQKSSDGSAYATGFSYYDKDEGHEVTLINLVTKLKDSSFVMAYEFALFSDKVQDDNCAAVKELCHYFDLDVPVTIAKN